MTSSGSTSFITTSVAETEAFALAIGACLGVGDTILLEGQVGAGKSCFARALIRSILPESERLIDIPSPTFTLVQTYDTLVGPLWHVDLYRLSSFDQIIELGLEDAMGDAICLIEWPDRLGNRSPSTALSIAISQAETINNRSIVLSWSSPRWNPLKAVVDRLGTSS
jgi:tRNA threonylcarbamoyladenosine biosynthesis protein TsaE